MARPGRAYWKGFLRLSLVSIGVEIYNAIDSGSEISFNQIHKPSGKRINYTKTVKGIGEVSSADIVKGYEVDKDQYIILDPEEIDSIKLESKKTVDLQQFVDVKEIDPRYFERPYYIVPADDHATEGYLVIRNALQKMNKVGVGQITMGGREHLVAVGPVDKGLVMEILRYANEIKPASSYFSDLPELKLDSEMVSLATELIGRKAASFEPQKYRDSYAVALKELVDEKAKGHTITAPSEATQKGGNVINLMDALRKSVQGDKGTKTEKVVAAKPEKPAPQKKGKAKRAS
ncbi:MAG: Ku protein [Hyphomicrobiales bacterium]